MHYRLAPPVHVCVTEDGAVFLDIEHDAYVGIDSEQERALAQVVEAWPREPASESRTDLAIEFAESLRARGLLVQLDEPGHGAQPPQLPPVQTELIVWHQMSNKRINIGTVGRCLRAVATAVLLIRCCSMSSVVGRYRSRAATYRTEFDFAAAQSLVGTFYHICPWIYARKGRCLFDSIVMLEFLSSYGIFPSWVFGVQLRPFRAHSWVQHEGWILNGTAEYARDYVPILVV